MKTPEGYEKDKIKQYLASVGAWWFMPMMGGYGRSGVSDIVGCYRGFFFAIEVKRPGKEPTALQYKRLREIINANGYGFWGTADKVIPEFEVWRAQV